MQIELNPTLQARARLGKGLALGTVVLSNLIVLIQVMRGAWTVAEVVTVYWCESVLIGALNVPKMALAQKTERIFPKSGTSMFFLVHYFGFMLGQGVFIYINFVEDLSALLTTAVAGSLVVLGGGHLFDFFANYVRKKEYAAVTANTVSWWPYPRVFITQLVVLAGGWFVMESKQSVAPVAILTICKIAVDGTMAVRAQRARAEAA